MACKKDHEPKLAEIVDTEGTMLAPKLLVSKAHFLLTYQQSFDAATGINSASEQPALRDLTVVLFLPTAAERRPFPLLRPVNV